MVGNVLLSVTCATAFASAALAGRAASASVERARTAVSLQPVSGAPEVNVRGRLANARKEARLVALYYLRNGVDAFMPFARKAMRGRVGRTFADAARLCARRGAASTAESLASVSCALLCAFSLFSVAVFRSVAAAVLLPLCAAMAASVAVSHGCAKEQETLREQVPDALRCMEACLHAGLSLPQAFSEVAATSAQPAKDTFQQVSRDLELGYSVSAALTRFHELAGLAELRFVAMALDVQYACGGSATPILRSAEESVARGLELRRALRVQTAQARLSAQVVGIMPVALLAVLSAVSPGFLAPFFASGQGMALLCAAVCMQVTGVVLVRRVLNVKL